MTRLTSPEMFTSAAGMRRGSSLLAVHDGQRGTLSRPADQGTQASNPPAAPRRRGFPGPASAPRFTSVPVPTPAHHPTPRAIRVRRSPR
ncbi:hypothetical protein SAMN05444521_5159 [Streptomyces sp. 3214.6]|nr:hypothetical protein SAMN05444521_5159 [Streptomyces sp. 3214.6]